MRHKLLSADPPITYAIALETGDEVVACLTQFIREQEVEAATLTAIGAFSRAVLGYFDWQTKQYRKIQYTGAVDNSTLSILRHLTLFGAQVIIPFGYLNRWLQ